jgi:hypothetical protein
MPNARAIPILNLNPDQELSADQIVQVANGELQVLTDDGEKVGILLPRKDRALFIAAITLGYVKYSRTQTRLAYVFCRWCDAKEIPCVSFEIEKDCVDMVSTNDSVEADDALVTMHFDVTTAGRPFTKAGLLAVAEVLLGNLWEIALSPWMVSAGVLPFSLARQIMTRVYEVWNTTSKPKAERAVPAHRKLKAPDSQTIH